MRHRLHTTGQEGGIRPPARRFCIAIMQWQASRPYLCSLRYSRRMALSTQIIATPVSANTAAHMLA